MESSLFMTLLQFSLPGHKTLTKTLSFSRLLVKTSLYPFLHLVTTIKIGTFVLELWL